MKKKLKTLPFRKFFPVLFNSKLKNTDEVNDILQNFVEILMNILYEKNIKKRRYYRGI